VEAVVLRQRSIDVAAVERRSNPAFADRITASSRSPTRAAASVP
jgi:hypothetical protein